MLAATPWPPGTPTVQSMWQVALLWLLLHEHEREGVCVHADPLGHPVTWVAYGWLYPGAEPGFKHRRGHGVREDLGSK